MVCSLTSLWTSWSSGMRTVTLGSSHWVLGNQPRQRGMHADHGWQLENLQGQKWSITRRCVNKKPELLIRFSVLAPLEKRPRLVNLWPESPESRVTQLSHRPSETHIGWCLPSPSARMVGVRMSVIGWSWVVLVSLGLGFLTMAAELLELICTISRSHVEWMHDPSHKDEALRTWWSTTVVFVNQLDDLEVQSMIPWVFRAERP